MIQKPFSTLALFTTIFVAFTICCTAQQSEEQALSSLRELSRDGKLPPENLVADIESRFAGKRTGALAKLLHARIRFEIGDFAGAASMLNSDEFRKRTQLADHALWLRGKALQAAGKNAESMAVIATLLRDFPDFVRARDAKLLWAEAAMQSGHAVEVPGFLVDLSEKNDVEALLQTAKAYELQNSLPEAARYYRQTYFFGTGTAFAKEAEAKLASLGQTLSPKTGEEAAAKANRLFTMKNYTDAVSAYADLASRFPNFMTPQIRINRLTSLAMVGRMSDAQNELNAIPSNTSELEAAYRQLVLGYAKAKQWPQTRAAADEMRQKFPKGPLVAKTWIDAGLAARDAKDRSDEGYFLNSAVAAFPDSIDVAQAQFEAAWFQHENGNFASASNMFVEHLARYAGKDTTNRGKAGYWAARDAERADKTADACVLYDAVAYRYGSNWYGYLAIGRLTALKAKGNCRSSAPSDPDIAAAVTNLKAVTVVAETATARELARAGKSDELSMVGLFDWAIDELNEAKKTANNSPKINLELARYYRFKGDNTSALLALRNSYPDYAQMFPEEMGREEWSIFYPLINWPDIKYWAGERRLDPYQVAGLIRQESVFSPRAKSPANAYGLMQLLVPTAQTVAKKYVSKTASVTSESLFQPTLNIELGTAYFRDMIDKFGRIEYVAAAYNAGPGRIPQWRAKLPAEIDEFVEAIPFKETKGYVQGVIRNTAQYRRLYDDNGRLKPNVGTRPLRGEIDTMQRDQFTAEFPDIIIDDSSGN